MTFKFFRTRSWSTWLCVMLLSWGPCAVAQTADSVFLEMSSAFKRGDSKQLTQLLPQTKGHILEPWAAYWELRARLHLATNFEVRQFLTRYANTYQEDRLRNDWLLQLGYRQEWQILTDEERYFRMRDDRNVQCYVGVAEMMLKGNQAPSENAQSLYRLWLEQRQADDACALAAKLLYQGGRLGAVQIWRKARLGVESEQQKISLQALEIVHPQGASELDGLWRSPALWLSRQAKQTQSAATELVVLALLRLAATDPGQAAKLMQTQWKTVLAPEQSNWVWGVLGRKAAQRRDPQALHWYQQVSQLTDLHDDLLSWLVRAALRSSPAPAWARVKAAIEAMSAQTRKDSIWVYWLARAELALQPGHVAARQSANAAFESIADVRGFYEQLALEELGRTISPPPRPEPPSPEELEQATQNPSFQRALYAIAIGLRAEGVREWNYGAHLVNAQGQAGRMSERELLASAALACAYEVWDRCINTSERNRALMDVEHSFPMPMRDAVTQRSQQRGLDPAFVYGLMRQESRFIAHARSHVGAAGLMQVMPATAAWTARKIGIQNFSPESINHPEVNIDIGTGYLKIVLDHFEFSRPLGAAAYNAGPAQVRKWHQGPKLEAAIWVENIPFSETRDYVKKVLSNTTVYAAIISGQPQSLKAQLRQIGPKANAASEPNDIP